MSPGGKISHFVANITFFTPQNNVTLWTLYSLSLQLSSGILSLMIKKKKKNLFKNLKMFNNGNLCITVRIHIYITWDLQTCLVFHLSKMRASVSINVILIFVTDNFQLWLIFCFRRHCLYLILNFITVKI